MALSDWNLAEALNVYQIALLSAGYDPAEFEDTSQSNWSKQVKTDTAAYLTTIKGAVLTGKIECEKEYDQQDFDRGIDWYESLIDIQSYVRWLKERNHEDKFFNCEFWRREESDLDRLLTPWGKFYPPKLAAAVSAWQAVTADPEAMAGKSPKGAIEYWLRVHAKRFGLINKDGKPNEQGIEEISKVANWKPRGGATPTPDPVMVKPTHPPSKRGGQAANKGGQVAKEGRQVADEAPACFARDELDEEIPF